MLKKNSARSLQYTLRIVMLLWWVIGIITWIVTYNKKCLFYKTFKDMLSEVYCLLGKASCLTNIITANIQIE